MIITLIQQAAPAGGAGPAIGGQFLMLALIGLIFYFLLIRPQSQRMKKHKAMLAEISRGDEVVTSGGLIGKVKKINDDEMTITLGANNDVKVVRSMIADVRNPKSAAND
ncbi:preprotein translocase subunit YajC [uncultured Algimonas sp.]|uniref:preprotein translocase subunit YajC n=1 Tax=uncultured Algimonas sp. TaxID=1547920 RepID=UPI0026032859|nr:preprotein translocase subunit YajC [uncultured Algimonas sp.]